MEENWIEWKRGDGLLKTHPRSIVDAKYSQKPTIDRNVYAYNVCTEDYSGLCRYRIVQEHPTPEQQTYPSRESGDSNG